MNLKNLKLIMIVLLASLATGCQHRSHSVQGYMDADYTYISSNFAGVLKNLFVVRGKSVTYNQNLFILDAQPQQAETQNARAKVEQAKAQLIKNQNEYNYQSELYARYQKLIKALGVSKEEFENVKNTYQNATAALNSSQANLRAAEADLEKAKWGESAKIVKAPVSGYVYDTYYTVGEYVQEGHPILSLVAPENLKVVFYISEPILSKLHLNQQVTLACDGCHASIPAAISYISSKMEYTPPVIYSEKNRAKFVFRIEAKSNDASFLKLHPGQPVTVNLNV